MPTPAELKHLADCALAERAAPVAAYDVIRADGEHPLAAWLPKEDSMPYAPNRLPPRGGGYKALDQDPDLDQPGQLDANNALQAVQQILDALDPSQRPALLAALQDLCGNEGARTAEGTTNMGASDARRALRVAQDHAFRARAARTSNFLERFPEMKRVEVWGGGGGY